MPDNFQPKQNKKPAPRPTKVKDPESEFRLPGEDREAQPLAKLSSQGVPADMPVPGKTASADKTRGSVDTSRLDKSQAAGHLSSLANSGLRDEVPLPEPPPEDEFGTDDGYPPDMLPALVNREIARQGDLQFEPEWHQVRNLPGYVESAIRALGRQIFQNYTSTPIEDIQVLSTLSNDGNEVKMMAALLKKKGTRLADAEMDFQRIMPGYRAQVAVYEFGAGQFLAVSDFGGHYIYSWPKEDGKYQATDMHGAGEAGQLQQGQKQLPQSSKAASIIHGVGESNRSKRL